MLYDLDGMPNGARQKLASRQRRVDEVDGYFCQCRRILLACKAFWERWISCTYIIVGSVAT